MSRPFPNRSKQQRELKQAVGLGALIILIVCRPRIVLYFLKMGVKDQKREGCLRRISTIASEVLDNTTSKCPFSRTSSITRTALFLLLTYIHDPLQAKGGGTVLSDLSPVKLNSIRASLGWL